MKSQPGSENNHLLQLVKTCKLSSEDIPLAYILVDFKGKVTAYESSEIYT